MCHLFKIFNLKLMLLLTLFLVVLLWFMGKFYVVTHWMISKFFFKWISLWNFSGNIVWIGFNQPDQRETTLRLILVIFIWVVKAIFDDLYCIIYGNWHWSSHHIWLATVSLKLTTFFFFFKSKNAIYLVDSKQSG